MRFSVSRTTSNFPYRQARELWASCFGSCPISFQKYEQSEFSQALREITGETVLHPPAYYVSGGGGAFLSVPPDPQNSQYRMSQVYPTLTDWKRINKHGHGFKQKIRTGTRRGISSVKLGQTVLDRALASREEGSLEDQDKPSLLSLLYLEIRGDSGALTPVFLSDLGEIYSFQLLI
jgi:hypothetical protein